MNFYIGHKKQKDHSGLIVLAIVIIVLGFIIAYACSCTNEKRVTAYVAKHPEIKQTICDSVRIIHTIDTIKGQPIITTITTQDTTSYQAFLDLVLFNASIQTKQAVDSCTAYWKKHPVIIKETKEIPTTIHDVQVINDPVRNQANYNKGFDKGKEYQQSLFNWWKLSFFCLLLLSFCVLIVEWRLTRKKPVV